MKRILYLSEGYSPHDRRFLAAMAMTPHKILFQPLGRNKYSLESNPPPADVDVWDPLLDGPFEFGFFSLVRAYVRLRGRLKKLKPDLIHAGPVPSASFLAALCGARPLLSMSWGSDVLVDVQRNPLKKWTASYALSKSALALADCNAVIDELRALRNLREDQMVKLPWGIELERYGRRTSTLGWRERLGWQKAIVVINSRGFEPVHAPLVFLRAFASAHAANPELRAIFLGTGRLKEAADKFIVAQGLNEVVYRPGQIPSTRLTDAFNEADLYVSSTLSDGTSISLLEAMACGLPAIVVDAHGNKEWVMPRENGWRYPAGDEAALSKVILEALHSKNIWPAMGAANQELVRQKADWNKNLSVLFSAYDKLLGLSRNFPAKEKVHARL